MTTEVTGSVDELLDFIKDELRCKNDLALSVELAVSHALISRLRHANGKVGAALLLKIHDRTGISCDNIRKIGGLGK